MAADRRPVRIGVTGAAGFIGSTLVDRLLEEGREVVGLDSFDSFYPEAQKLDNLSSALRSEHFKLIRGDIRDAATIETFFSESRFDAVVHLAALAGVRPSLERPALYADVNLNGTVNAIEKNLKHGQHLFRYTDADDFGVPETAFTVCTFWYIEALAVCGRHHEAREMFEHILTCRNSLGLLSEDIDPSTGELWGNFPQTYSMVGLIKCAMRLSESWEEAF